MQAVSMMADLEEQQSLTLGQKQTEYEAAAALPVKAEREASLQIPHR